jgi:hypothetical protein
MLFQVFIKRIPSSDPGTISMFQNALLCDFSPYGRKAFLPTAQHGLPTLEALPAGVSSRSSREPHVRGKEV